MPTFYAGQMDYIAELNGLADSGTFDATNVITVGTSSAAGSSPRQTFVVATSGSGAPSDAGTTFNGDKLLMWNVSTYKANIGVNLGALWFQSNGSAVLGTTPGHFQWWGGNATTPIQLMSLRYTGVLALHGDVATDDRIRFSPGATGTGGIIDVVNNVEAAYSTLSLQGSKVDLYATSLSIEFRTSLGMQVQIANGGGTAVNHIQLRGAATSALPGVYAQGSDSNVSLALVSQGTGTINIYTNSAAPVLQVQVDHIASGVNYMTLRGSATGAYVRLSVAGSDADCGINILAKGTAPINFYTNVAAPVLQVAVDHIANAVNWMTLRGAATGGYVRLSVAGSDTDCGINIIAKGAASIYFQTNVASPVIQLEIVHTASSVNWMTLRGAATGASPMILITGSNTDIGLVVTTKGTGATYFYSNGLGALQFGITHTASATNYLVATGGASAAPTLAVLGADTNVDLSLAPKGTGVVKFGTHTGTGDTATNGYVTIKDSGGTNRRLATVA